MAARALAAAAAALAVASAARPVSFVHLAPDSDATVMHVQWASVPGDKGAPTVQWGAAPGSLAQSQGGYSWGWSDAGRSYQSNLATMTGLVPGSRVFYRVGSAQDGWSAVSNFTATRTAFSADAPLRIGWVGDLGYDNAQVRPCELRAPHARARACLHT